MGGFLCQLEIEKIQVEFAVLLSRSLRQREQITDKHAEQTNNEVEQDAMF